jgi:hypothetical protein
LLQQDPEPGATMRDQLGLFARDKNASVMLASAECRKAEHDA